jgi:hypothetical protein
MADRRDTRFVWTDEITAELKRVLQAGMTAEKASKAVGCTRNAAISKARRMGFPLKSGLNGGEWRQVEPPKRPRRVHKAKSDPISPKSTAPDNPRLVTLRTVPLQADPVPLVELCACGCRWPLDGEHEGLFCNAVQDDERPYCKAHSSLAFMPAKVSPRDLARSLRRYTS